MRAFLIRLAGCWGALAVFGLLFPGRGSLGGVLWGGALLAVLYVVIRPLLQTVLLPLNLLLFGIFTPLTDAWLVLWAWSWSGFAGFSYWAAVGCALLISLFWAPFARSRSTQWDKLRD